MSTEMSDVKYKPSKLLLQCIQASGEVRRRFSSIEPRSPNSPLTSPGSNENHIYTLPDDDAVFAEEKEVPKDNNNFGGLVPPPPTPGTAPAADHASKQWSRRRLRPRHIACVVVGVVLFICAAVATALAVILFSSEAKAPKSLPVSASPRTIAEIHYTGHLTLSSPWQGGEAELERALHKDLNTILQLSSLYRAFINASFVNISTDLSTVRFILSFDKLELEDIVASSGGNLTLGPAHGNTSMPLAEALQSALRKQVVTQSGAIQLPIEAETVVILENIPNLVTSVPETTATPSSTSSTQAFTTEPEKETTSSSSAATATATATTATTKASTSTKKYISTPTTASVPGTTSPSVQCLTMNFSPCRDLLGSSTFHLPNWLEHSNPEQAISAYSELLSTRAQDTGQACDLVSTRYLCALLFPPCGEDGGDYHPPFHPCDSLCRAVLTECGVIEGWPGTCDALPAINCTSLPVVTTSLPSTTAEEATTEATETSTAAATTVTSTDTTMPSTTTEVSYQCARFELPICNEIGFTESLLPNTLWNCDDNDCLIKVFDSLAGDSIRNGCHRDLTFFCSYVFHGCSYDLDGSLTSIPIRPCMETCTQAVEECSSFMPLPPKCSDLVSELEDDVQCVSTQREEVCINQTHPVCMDIGFTTTSRESWYSENITVRISQFDDFALSIAQSGCSEHVKFVLCGSYFPTCLEESGEMGKVPCRKYCEEMKADCSMRSITLDCSLLPAEDNCLHPSDLTVIDKEHSTTSLIPETTAAPSTTTTSGPKCEKLRSPLCETFGYTEVSFPNAYGSTDHETANKTYYSFAERAVASGCTQDVAFYLCTVIFPPCNEQGTVALPCSSVCEEVNDKCKAHLFVQVCGRTSSLDTTTCLQPPPKKECSDNEFTCINANKCIPQSAVCNQVNDCEDWSDERHCNCHESLEVKCAMGMCIPSYNRCDGKTQCPDGSDEYYCDGQCIMGDYKCLTSEKCIPREWLCDGTADCIQGDDEDFCDVCDRLTEFTCRSDLKCISLEKHCDGTLDCDDGSDESQCIWGPNGQTLADIYLKRLNKDDPEFIHYPVVCSEGFTEAHALLACLRSGYPSLQSLSEGPSQFSSEYFQLDSLGPHTSGLGRGFHLQNGTCPKNLVVKVICNPKGCGKNSHYFDNAIINGQDAGEFDFPWVVSMQHVRIHKCGGAIIHPYFVLTAAHCARDIYEVNKHVRVVAGTVNLDDARGEEPYKEQIQVNQVRRIIQYPGYKNFNGKDVALLELKKPFKYTDRVRQLCLPEQGDIFTRRSSCRLAGWGHTRGINGSTAIKLQKAKMTLVDTQTCNSTYMWDGSMAENEKCAGYYNGRIAACSGDSGSSLMCKDTSDFWKTVGITSYVGRNCDVPRYPMVYTDIVPFIDWVQNQTVCMFTCANGICLFDKGMLCDAKDDCGDRSDEIQLCPISTNCTFDDKYSCGYTSKLVFAYRAGPGDVNRYPLYDHTFGRYPGHFQIMEERVNDLHTPRIDIMSAHCMRFYYHGRGSYRSGFSVVEHNLNKGWFKSWETITGYGQDRWLMGYFDLSPGHYNIVFRSHEDKRWSLDDILLMEGTCDEMECLADEFMCMIEGSKNCLPLAVQCNIAVDCDNAEDERNCTDPSYICDFSNGNVCGIRQHNEDFGRSDWQLINATGSPDLMRDHTTGLASGTMLKVDTTKMLSVDQVLASMDVYLRTFEHCISFYYFSSSPYTFEIILRWDNKQEKLMGFTDRQTETWTMTQIELPAVAFDQQGTLTIVVTGGDRGSQLTNEVFLLDDITIVPGQCPEFTCPIGSLKCQDEAYCVPNAKVCDYKSHCAKATDEIECVCTTSEYKCPQGPCIFLNKTCDNNFDCTDHSDEGSICDSKRTVTCDFEDPFQCGYTVSTARPSFHWARVQGRTADPGPGSDHTYLGDDTQLGFYALALSQFEGADTAITSPAFDSTGNGLLFYYHARHFLHDVFMTGSLSVVVKDLNTNVETEIWSRDPDNSDVWKQACVSLPPGLITVSFVAVRGEGTASANIGLDDIEYLETTCDIYLTGFRTGNGWSKHPSHDTTTPLSNTGCSSAEYTCRNGMCISNDMVCDGIPDCPDGYDELACD